MNLFQPENFKNDPYAWLTNQIGHVSFSFILCYYTGLPLVIVGLWLAWEAYHWFVSHDTDDFIQDLTFEILGVLIYLQISYALEGTIAMLVGCYVYKELRK